MIRNVILACSAIAALLAAAAVGAEPAQPEEYNDIVRQDNNNPATNVKVIADSWDGVQVKLPGGGATANTSLFTSDTVEGVDYASKPAEYEKAMELLRAGKFVDAIKAFDEGMRRLRAGDAPQRQYFILGKIECFAALRKPDDVRKLVDEMLSAGRDNPPRLIFEAYLKLGASYFQARDFAKAEDAYKRAVTLFDSLEAKARSSGKGGLEKFVNRYALEAKLNRIRCMEELKQLDGPEATGADMAYQVFPARAAGHADLVARAEVGRGRCMILRKDYAGALRYLEGLTKKVPEAALPLVFCAMGDAYLARASSENSDELDYYQARWYYLKVVVQYPTDRAALARAYYGAGLCYEGLGRESDALARKVRMFETVTKEFPDSPEYLLASEKLGAKSN